MALWRTARVGVRLTRDGVEFRGYFVDEKVPWAEVVEIGVSDGVGELGETVFPVIRTAEGEYDVAGLTGYTRRGRNRRVDRAVRRMNAYWASVRPE
ncbi:hypothetical protein E1263_42160 [Kribbella antibiotica]|uniref:Uncharacterized protein n=1 Tax=Kribbella antibiotica TaxID=190195 RepID=A0A4R4YF26_9ACTN|nr:hypothetical protein [Kribbella antibiotica]TDD42524.1 hypothetical protein E1263_42160 [Kribbella antibiotica]